MTKNNTGKVVSAYGNLLHVEFDNNIKQGEVGYVKLKDLSFASEVIEIADDVAKVQVFEDTKGIQLGAMVEFSNHLLEAELGPGLLTSVFDGLQNPLEKIAEKAGLFLSRGLYLLPLDREKKWDFYPKCQVKNVLSKGETLGEVEEKIFRHKIMVPFALKNSCTITWVAKEGSYSIDEVIAKAEDNVTKEKLEFTMVQRWPIKTPLIEGKKVKPYEIMSSGLRVIDTQLPLLKGGTFCSPGPFGAGKTVLQHHLAKHSTVDIVVVAACGERAGEVVEVLREFPRLVDEKTNKPLMDRTCIICNTSSMPVAAREASVYMGVTIAEYYRQMGLNILLLADSTSRWAQAMREMSGRLEEIPGEEAFPAYLASRIAAFYERAGALQLKDGSVGTVTIGGTVSPAGGNFEEPVTQSTLSVVGAFLGLSRERSDARRYPAIDPLISWTKYLHQTSQILSEKVEGWEGKVQFALQILQQGDEIEKRMEVVGEEGTSIEDIVTYLKSELYDICYLQQNAFDPVDAYCPLQRQIELFELVQKIFSKKFTFDTRDDARGFFLNLQNEIKNANYLPFGSEKYSQTMKGLYEKINEIGGL